MRGPVGDARRPPADAPVTSHRQRRPPRGARQAAASPRSDAASEGAPRYQLGEPTRPAQCAYALACPPRARRRGTPPPLPQGRADPKQSRNGHFGKEKAASLAADKRAEDSEHKRLVNKEKAARKARCANVCSRSSALLGAHPAPPSVRPTSRIRSRTRARSRSSTRASRASRSAARPVPPSVTATRTCRRRRRASRRASVLPQSLSLP